jgi:hypothetical protein
MTLEHRGVASMSRLLPACFLCASALLAASRASATVPTPDEVLGFRPGADYKLADYATIVKYFRALDAGSERVVVRDIGETVEGRTMIAAFISSEANLAKLDRHREISRRLALARGLDEAQARALAAEGRGRGLDRLRPARERGRAVPARAGARVPGGHRGQRGDAPDPGLGHPAARPGHEPGRPGPRGELVRAQPRYAL